MGGIDAIPRLGTYLLLVKCCVEESGAITGYRSCSRTLNSKMVSARLGESAWLWKEKGGGEKKSGEGVLGLKGAWGIVEVRRRDARYLGSSAETPVAWRGPDAIDRQLYAF